MYYRNIYLQVLQQSIHTDRRKNDNIHTNKLWITHRPLPGLRKAGCRAPSYAATTNTHKGSVRWCSPTAEWVRFSSTQFEQYRQTDCAGASLTSTPEMHTSRGRFAYLQFWL